MKDRKVIDDQIRSSVTGSFIKLSNGTVHYELGGPEDGKQVVLVCGLVTPLFGWDKTFKALADDGYRVLRFDLYGRGFSDRPDMKYTPDVFVHQLHELMLALKLKKKITLVGWSMGGAISMFYSSKYPEKISKLVLVASAGFPPKLPLAFKLLTVPVFGKWLMSKFGEKSIFKGLRGHFSDPDAYPDYYKNSTIQMQYKGFKRTLLSTMINFPFNQLSPLVAKIGKLPIPVLLIWGKKDDITPYDSVTQFKEAIPHAQLLDFKEAKHAVHYEYYKQVNEEIIAFLGA